MVSRPASTRLPSGAMLIGSDWVSDASAGSLDHYNPATGRVLASFAQAGPAEIDRAVAAARAAFPGWRAWAPGDRRESISRVGRLLEEHDEELAAVWTLETGVPFRRRRRRPLAAEWFHYYAGWCDKIAGETVPVHPGRALDYTIPEPYGVVAVLIPWNAPVASAGMKVAPALAAGNCVVLKPSELGPFAALRLAELCVEAGLPPGVLNVVPGGPEAGAALVSHRGVDKISFTGGAATARKILGAAAANLTPVLLELGGKSANIVFADADLEAAATTAVQTGIVNNAGQACVLPTRLLVQDEAYAPVVERVVGMSEAVVVGDPFDPATQMGPVITESACRRILEVVERGVAEGAGRLLTGGRRLGGDLSDGYFLPPTVFGEVDPGSALAQEEIFGPVLSVIRFRTEDEAVAIANGTRYGLGGLVYTSDLKRAHRVAARLEAGSVGINAFPPMPPGAPFGGVKESGFGREGGLAGIQEFVRPKNVYVDLG